MQLTKFSKLKIKNYPYSWKKLNCSRHAFKNFHERTITTTPSTTQTIATLSRFFYYERQST